MHIHVCCYVRDKLIDFVSICVGKVKVAVEV